KGSGKTANFLKLTAALEADKRNLVCVIKPLSYEMHGILELLQRYHSIALRGYAVESIWKFLVYSEIALTTETAIKNRLSSQIYEHEKDLIAVLDQNSEVLRQDFSVRLERCVQALLANESILSGGRLDTSQVGVSEALHSGLLRKLRLVLVSALEEKRRIAILVDNLDKAWDKQSDVEKLREFLLGLLGATG